MAEVVNGPGEASQTEIGLTGRRSQDNNLLYSIWRTPYQRLAASEIIKKVVQLVEEKGEKRKTMNAMIPTKKVARDECKAVKIWKKSLSTGNLRL